MSRYFLEIIFIFTSATKGEEGYVFTPLCLFVCLFLASSKIFQVYWSVDFVILSVYLFDCLLITKRSQF